MAIYLVVPLGDDLSKFKDALIGAAGSPSAVHPLQNNRGFLVQFTGTTKELADAAQITLGDANGTVTGQALVTLVGGYWGVGNSDMWEWISSRSNQ